MKTDMNTSMNKSMSGCDRKYTGKYRGVVVNNVDPKNMGRLMVKVPDVSNFQLSSWAMPCVPIGGIQNGMYVIPAINSGVWVEFEQGDPDYPIWVGYYWGSAVETPSMSKLLPPGIPAIVMQTPTQSALVVSDMPVPPMQGPGAMMCTPSSSVTVDASGVTIRAPVINLVGGAINITGPTNINYGALKVT